MQPCNYAIHATMELSYFGVIWSRLELFGPKNLKVFYARTSIPHVQALRKIPRRSSSTQIRFEPRCPFDITLP